MRTNSRSGNPRKTQNRALTFGSSVATALLLALALGFYGCSEQLPLAPDTSPAQQTQGDENVIEGQYIVVLKSTQQIGQRQAGVFKRTKQDVSRVALNNGVEPLEVYSTVVHGFTVKLTRGQYELLQNDPTVDYIEPDRPVHMTAQTVPWGITEVNAPVAHARGTRGSGVKVGVLDTGIDHGHVDLAANYVSGIDFVNNDNNPMDDNGHGTHVSGTIAAVDNTFGVLGVAPSASLYGIKVLDRFGSGSFGDVIAGIDWSAANGLDVINMSLGASVGTNSLRTACDNAFASGVVICAAAGNDNGAPVNFPAVYSSVIAVSAIDQNLNLAGFSNRGPEVEVTAPGVGVISTFINNQYATGDGTSMSSPHVAGVAALIWSTGQFTTATAVRDQLGATAVDLGSAGRDNDFGFGLVDADAATSGGGGNQAPTANANGPYTGETGAAVSFSSAGSSDPDGTITDYSWDFGDGGSSAAANPTHSYAAAGTYTVTLTVTDDQGATGSNSTTATISDPPNNNPPVADFSGSPTSGDAPLTVDFTDLSTNGPTGWSWDFGDGGSSGAQNPSYTYNNPGTYTVSLTATNANGSNTMTKGGYITANTPPPPPPPGEGFILSRNADFSTDDRTFTTAETMYMKVFSDAVDFTDMKKEQWELRDAGKNKVKQSLTNNNDGTWTAAFALSGLPSSATSWTWKSKLQDNGGSSFNPTTSVTITQGGGGNQAPTANANGPYGGTVGNAVSFSSAGSSDPDGSIVGYSWDFGDGGSSNQANPSYAYSAAGTYTVTLTVTDDQGATGTDATTADITGGGANQPPTANPNGPYSGTVGNAVSFSSAGSSDPDGSIVGYSWDFGDGGSSAQANPSHTYSAAGTYTVSLTVTDDQGATGSASTTADITGGGGGGDVVVITKAQYDEGKQKLDVRATSDNPNATLTVVGFGVMTYKARKNRWELKVQPVSPGPTSITVTSDFGGSDTSPVTLK